MEVWSSGGATCLELHLVFCVARLPIQGITAKSHQDSSAYFLFLELNPLAQLCLSSDEPWDEAPVVLQLETPWLNNPQLKRNPGFPKGEEFLSPRDCMGKGHSMFSLQDDSCLKT